MIRITFSWVTKLSIGGLLLVASTASIRAQNTCDKAPLPCFDQPREGDTQVTGKVTVDAMGKPTVGAVIMIKVNDAAAQPAQVKSDGTFTLAGLPGLNRFNTVRADQTQPAPLAGAATPTTGPVPVLPANSGGDSNDVPSRFTLGLFGINAAGSSSSGPSQQYFAEIDLLAPLRWLPHACSKDDNNDSLSRRCWVWINPRIASVPSASSTAINSLSSTSLTTSFGSQTLGQITQSFEFQAGAEYYVIKPSDTRFWGMGQGWAKSAASLIFGGGALTPFNSITTAPEFGLSSNLAQQFNQNASLSSLYPQLALALCNFGFTGSNCPATPPATKPTTVAFVFPNRSRFDRAFFVGLRLRFFYFTGDCDGTSQSGTCKAMNTYPGTFDLRFGEDESVTGGHLVPLVVTLTGSFPVPGTKGALRLFGSSYIRAHRNQDTLALVLVPSSNFTSLDNPAVVVQPILRSDQDYFRLGLGLDLFPLLSKLKGQ
jgi:hypothetical protein